MHPAALFAAGITVKAQGEALSGPESDAKERAVEEAINAGVKTAVETLIKDMRLQPDMSIVEVVIYSNPRTFLLNYKILSEETMPALEGAEPDAHDAESIQDRQAEVFRVLIEASFDQGSLRSILAGLAPTGSEAIPITIVVLDVEGWGEFKSLVDMLKSTAVVKNLSYTSFFRARFVLSADITVPVPEFTERAAKEAGEGYLVTELKPGIVVIKALSGDEGF
ncbi:MAG: hypothetical protein HY887_09745 [Deltaproteobacteria bacterium]|nr:hypothetical protein [Deltaproteobacteria bacterium]